MNDNVLTHNFKNYKKTSVAKRKKRARTMAIIGALLMLSSLIGSIVCYLI